MRRRLILCAAAAGFAATSLFTATPADAAYRIIKWDATRVCQIWNFTIGNRPIPANYRVVSGPIGSYGAALSVKNRLWRSGRCSL
jgi:hypothetical protein